MSPLTNDEAALLYHVSMWGAPGYPIEKRGRRWWWRTWRSVGGSATPYKTKREAAAAFEIWQDLARQRFAEMRKANPNVTLTAVGVRA